MVQTKTSNSPCGNRLKKLWVGAFCAGLLALPFLPAFAQYHGLTRLEPAKPGTGLIMKRHNGLGPEMLFASTDGVKINYPQANYCVISKPPEWKVLWFSTSAKTQFEQTIQSYRTDKGMPPKSIVVRAPAATSQYAHCKAIRVSRQLTPQEAANDFSGVASNYNNVGGRALSCDYFFLEPYQLPPQALNFITTFYGTPNFGCVPLALEVHQERFQSRKGFDTLEIKTGPIARSEFDSPRGFKNMRSRDAVSSGGGLKKDMESIFGDLKVGDKFGSGAP